jgi:transcriptional regulator with GAF, ATPase, and Fis domain
MKTSCACFSTDISPGLGGFLDGKCAYLSSTDSSVPLVHPTIEFANCSLLLSPELAQADNEDQLILQLRGEAAKLLACDNVCLTLPTEGYFRVFQKNDGYQSKFFARGRQTSGWVPSGPRALPEEIASVYHFKAGIQAPFRTNGNFGGALSFLANVPKAVTGADLLAAQRIADSFGIVLSMARRRWKKNELAMDADADWKNDLVQMVCECPDIHRILPRISALMQRVIPHDRLTISFHDKERNISLRSVSNNDGPTFERFQLSRFDCPPDGTSLIINDWANQIPTMKPVHFHPKSVDAGYRSFLVTHVWTGQHGLGFVFWSKRTRAFLSQHVPFAQSMADICAVAASKKELVPDLSFWDEPRTRVSKFRRVPEPHRAEFNETGIKLQSTEPQSTGWLAVAKSARQVASSDATVLVVGETGTGKEIVARMIYAQSARSNGPFVAVNCAALPDTLLESELFGYVRGAFTGAYHHRRGHIEVASGGVLFLDELSEMSLSAQAKVLRVLEMKQFQPLGSSHTHKADVRIIAATNKNLRQEISAGRFRADLYYRLGVFEIAIPPLRSRREDILPLAYKFLAEDNGAPSKPRVMSAAAEIALLAYHWPGNVRELRNVIERASIICNGNCIDAEHLKFESFISPSTSNEMGRIECEMIERALRECSGNKARAARQLGLTRTQLYVRLRRYAIAQQ